jgi:RNA polymerase sigma factor (sigma-70 family)
METTKALNFNEVYAKYYNKVLQHVNYKTSNSIHAEDITAEVFIKANKHFDNYNPEFAMSTWLITIANRLIIDYFRKYGREEANTMKVDSFVDSEGKEFIEFEGDNGNEVSDNRELREAILKAFATLKPKYRRIANLFFMQEMEYKEIAEICNVPMGTVKGMISRCREMLQAQLQNV